MRAVFYIVWSLVGLVVLVAAAFCGVVAWQLVREFAPTTESAPLAPGATASAKGFTVTVHDIRDPMPGAWAREGERIVGFDLGVTAGDDYSGGCFDFVLVDEHGNEARSTVFLPQELSMPRPQELKAELKRGETARGWCLFAVPTGVSLRALRFEPALLFVTIEFRGKP
jgi:hypothetical protein